MKISNKGMEDIQRYLIMKGVDIDLIHNFSEQIKKRNHNPHKEIKKTIRKLRKRSIPRSHKKNTFWNDFFGEGYVNK